MARTQEAPFKYSFETRGNVLALDLTDWSGETEGMDAAERDWLSRASKPAVTAAVTEFSADMSLGRDTQNHLAKEWSKNGHEADIEKLAFVSDGLKARAVSANLDVPQEINTFGSTEDAVEWASK